VRAREKKREKEREGKKTFSMPTAVGSVLGFASFLLSGFVIRCFYSINRRVFTITIYYGDSYSFSKEYFLKI